MRKESYLTLTPSPSENDKSLSGIELADFNTLFVATRSYIDIRLYLNKFVFEY